MNKDEMIEEMAKTTNFTAFDYRQGTIQSKTIYTAMAESLYNANCRIIGEDEIVVKKSEYEELRLAKYKAMEEAIEYEKTAYQQFEQAKQEEAGEILTTIYNNLKYATFKQTGALSSIKTLANELGIELENKI